MTNELEKQFFDTFGIKKELNTCEIGRFGRCAYAQPCVDTCPNFKSRKFYPQITDRILLGLIVVMTRYTDIIEGFDSIDELKNFVLTDLMYSLTQSEADIVKHQVRTLFEEG